MSPCIFCIACGQKLGPKDYPREKTVIYGIQIAVPILCWNATACLKRAEENAWRKKKNKST